MKKDSTLVMGLTKQQMDFNKSERQHSSHKLNGYYKFRKTIFLKKKKKNSITFAFV